MSMLWFVIGGLVIMGSLLAISYIAFATFFRVNARALERQAGRESIPTVKTKKKSVSVGK